MTIWEGRKMIEAARKYKRVVQCGVQDLSAPYGFSAREYIKSGKLGKVVHVKVFDLLPGGGWAPQPDSPVPSGFDWDEWLGPAAKVPYNRGRHRGWYSWWAYSGGTFGGNGIHQVTLARRVMNDPPHPKSVYCAGGRLAFSDARETPDMQAVTYDYGDFTMTCECAAFPPYMKKSQGDVRYGDKFPDWRQNSTRIEIYGTQRMMYLGRVGGGWQVLEGDGKVVDFEYGYFPDKYHQANFIESIRTRKRPNGDIEQGHYGACLVHLANMSLRLGKTQLIFDEATETCVGNDDANKMLKPQYREGFAIADQV
jgi:predicted dehydrogenase